MGSYHKVELNPAKKIKRSTDFLSVLLFSRLALKGVVCYLYNM